MAMAEQMTGFELKFTQKQIFLFPFIECGKFYESMKVCQQFQRDCEKKSVNKILL